MKKLPAVILMVILALSLCSCKPRVGEDFLDKLEGKWIAYEDGYLYYAIFDEHDGTGHMSYGSVRDMDKNGGYMSDIESLSKTDWKFRVENRAASCDITDIDSGKILLSNLEKDGKILTFERYGFDDNEWLRVRELSVVGPLRCYVNFDSNGGNEISSGTYMEGDLLPALPVPVRKGYEFAAWKDRSGKKWTEGMKVTEDLDLIAEYKDGRVIKLDTRGGESIAGIYVRHGDPLPELPVPKRKDSIFNRWTDSDKNTVEEGTVLPPEIDTIYAWYFGAVTLKFDSDGGGDFSDIVVREGSPLPELPEPRKKGYEFICWKDRNGSTVSEGAKLTEGTYRLTAYYEKRESFTIYFDSCGGTACDPITVYDGDPLPVLPVPEKEGYRFVCWNDISGNPVTMESLLECEDITLYASYAELIKFTVYFDSNGGSACSPITLTEGEALPALPVPVKDGYEFVCWKDKNGMPMSEGTFLDPEDITLYAEYTEL